MSAGPEWRPGRVVGSRWATVRGRGNPEPRIPVDEAPAGGRSAPHRPGAGGDVPARAVADSDPGWVRAPAEVPARRPHPNHRPRGTGQVGRGHVQPRPQLAPRPGQRGPRQAAVAPASREGAGLSRPAALRARGAAPGIGGATSQARAAYRNLAARALRGDRRPRPEAPHRVRRPFRDRMVHHALCAVIEPLFERCFVFGSYPAPDFATLTGDISRLGVRTCNRAPPRPCRPSRALVRSRGACTIPP